MIPFLDLKEINAQYRDELIEAATNVIDSGWYIQGSQTKAFEQSFTDYCGTKQCIGVANGLDALTLIFGAYKELGQLKEGDEVLVKVLDVDKNGRISLSRKAALDESEENAP